jgi:nitrogen fixation protein FixH
MKKGWYWPWFIVALLVATAAGQGVMLYAATHDSTFSLEPDYYKKAVAYDTVIKQERENLALGWTATATVGPLVDGARDVVLTLTDGAAHPIPDAHVRVTAIHNLEGDHHIAQALSAQPDGRFAARMPLLRSGLWELRVDVMRGHDRFMPSLRVEAPGSTAK